MIKMCNFTRLQFKKKEKSTYRFMLKWYFFFSI